MRMWVYKLLVSVAMVSSTRGALAAREAADLSVRLFSTADVTAVQLEGRGVRFRLCAGCAAESLRSPLKMTASGGQLRVDGRLAAQAFVDGDVTATTADGRMAQGSGRWSVTARRDGLHVLVQVPSERYVMAVLQAESAANEPMESLKALAVVVRSFAMQDPQRHGAEGLCDSTHCQALRFGPVPTRVREAVEATSGETLWFGLGTASRQVSGYFTQNCGGMTEDAAAVWGGERKPWLVAHADPFCVRQPALWHAELGFKQVRDALGAEGFQAPERITAVRVVKTDVGGRVAELAIGDSGTRSEGPGLKPRCSPAVVQGPKSPCSLRPATSGVAGVMRISAATLRFALNRAFGWNELRSDWYRVSVVDGRVVFDGRGYGHGVGLCQAGALGMAAQGRSYREILGFYFPGAAVRVLAGDAGWASRQAGGWILRATAAGNEWARAGDAAWARARAVFPLQMEARPTVTVYPTTELFREATGEPGWELAATRGTTVAVQPAAVVARVASLHHSDTSGVRGGSKYRGLSTAAARGSASGRDDKHFRQDGEALEALLVHEFLHVLVETDAGPKAPLWLREGLVEVLAGEPQVADTERESPSGRGEWAMSPAEIEAGLAGAGNWAESQRAHAAACARVRSAVQRYGLGAVRGWLRSGVPAGVELR